MGMFDSVLVRYPLDEPAHNQFWYQTKDLECQLSRYIVDEQGYLWMERVQYQSEEGGPFGFQLRAVSKHTEQVPFHGDLDLYTSSGHDGSSGILYRLRFIDGKVSRVAQCKTRDEHGFLEWPQDPFPPLEPRPTALVPPVFP